MAELTRACCLIVKTVLIAGLMAWTLAAPLVWILRDGLGPAMVETSGLPAMAKFAVGWGLPALAMAVPLAALVLVGRSSTRPAARG